MPKPTNLTPTDTTEDTAEAVGEVSVPEFKRKTVGGVQSFMLRSLFLNLMGFATSLVLAAYLSLPEFGVFGLITQIVGLLQFFSDIGFGPTLIQQKHEPSVKELRVVFSVQQFLTWGAFLICVILSQLDPVQAKLGEAGVWVLLALGLSLPIVSLRVISSILLERKLDFSKQVIPSVVEQVVYNVILLSMVLSGYGVISYAYAIIVRAVVGTATMFLIQRWPVGLGWDWSQLKQVLRVGTQFQLSDFLARIKDNLFFIVMGWWWLSLSDYGYISWAKGWSQMPYMLTVQNVIAITFPAYARLQHDKKLLAKAIEKTIYFITISIFPVLVGMSVFLWPLTQLVERYHKWEPAVPTFIWFAFSIGWAAISTPLTNTLAAIGKVNIMLRLMIMWTVLTWLITPALIKLMGFNGVGVATGIIALTSIIPAWLVAREVPVKIWESVWRQLMAAGAMALVGLAGLSYWSHSWRHLILGMVLTSVTYGLMILLTGREKLLAELKSLKSH